jgi:hypothetical protein
MFQILYIGYIYIYIYIVLDFLFKLKVIYHQHVVCKYS